MAEGPYAIMLKPRGFVAAGSHWLPDYNPGEEVTITIQGRFCRVRVDHYDRAKPGTDGTSLIYVDEAV